MKEIHLGINLLKFFFGYNETTEHNQTNVNCYITQNAYRRERQSRKGEKPIFMLNRVAASLFNASGIDSLEGLSLAKLFSFSFQHGEIQ